MWKDVVGFEGLYEVDEYGNVFSIRTGKILKQQLDERGYPKIHMSDASRGLVKNMKVHRIVALAHIPNPDNLPCVNHIDEDKLNNHVSNLEWCTVAYNNAHGTRMKKIKDKLCKGVSAFDLNGNFLKSYDMVSDVANDGYLPSGATSCASGSIHTHYDTIFIYNTFDIEKELDLRLKSLNKKFSQNPNGYKNCEIVQYKLGGEEVGRYKNISEASRKTGFNHGAITQCCNGKAKTHKGYLWKRVYKDS